MECLPGKSLAAAIENEQSEMAAALGLSGGAQELRKRTLKMLKTSFRNDKNGKTSDAKLSGSPESTTTTTVKIDPEVAIDTGVPLEKDTSNGSSSSGGGKMFGALSDRFMALAPELAAWAAAGLRTYASTRRSVLDLQARVTAVLQRLFASLFSVGSLSSAAANAGTGEEGETKMNSSGLQRGDDRSSSNSHMLSDGTDGSTKANARVDVGRCLEVRVARNVFISSTCSFLSTHLLIGTTVVVSLFLQIHPCVFMPFTYLRCWFRPTALSYSSTGATTPTLILATCWSCPTAGSGSSTTVW
jgi:hypothetical protein